MPISFLSLVIERLELDAAQTVDAAVACFSNIPPPPDSEFVTLSGQNPTLFTSLNTLDESLNALLALPAPSPSQLAGIRQLLDQSSSQPVVIAPTSLCILYLGHRTYVPVWTVQIWLRLYTLIRLALAWFKALSSLVVLAESSSTAESLVSSLFDHLSTLAFDSPAPNTILRHFRTSHLPTLIQNEWLSDDHINACAEFINGHPEHTPGVYALNSHFMDYMHRQFERSPTYPASRLTTLDRLIIESSVTELLIPLHLPSHWVLLHVNLVSQNYSFTDTLDLTEIMAPPVTINLLNRWLAGLLGHAVALVPSSRVFRVGAQFDSSSCGVAVMSSMAHYTLGGSYRAWAQSSTMEHRLAWALRFLGPIDNVIPTISETFLEDLDDNLDNNTLSSQPSNPIAPFDSLSDASSDSLSDVSSDASSESSDDDLDPRPMPQSQLRQTTLPFKSISRDEWLVQEKRRYADSLVDRQEESARLEQLAARMKVKHREYERNRKRDRRARQREARAAAKKLRMDLQREVKGTLDLLSARRSISSLSRPYSLVNAAASRQDPARLTRRKVPLQPTGRINWCQDIYWGLIDSAARAVGYPWRPVDIVQRLRLLDPNTFQFLRPQRISQWRDHRFPDVLQWTEAHMRAIKAGARPGVGPGRRSIFHNHPNIVEMIKRGLLALRKTGVSLNLKAIRGYIMGVIQHYIPDAFLQTFRYGHAFRCSERFVQRFLREELGWSVRKATRAAQKYPSNVRDVLLKAFLRIACAVRDFVVPASCIVNADQTQVVYSSGDQRTWTMSGERQINVLGAEEKRAFTLMVGVSGSGALLPFQAIYGGKSTRSVPGSDAPGYLEAQQLGFLLEYSNTSTYWSTFETMCHWVSDILVPYFRAQMRQANLPEGQRCILQLDCWSVHRSAQFRTWMRENYPWIIFDYVPGGCTGLFQACDVGIQRVLKLAIRNAAHADVVAETVNALQSGTEPQYVVNDQSLPTLRRRSLNWIVQAYHAVNRPDLIKKAFLLCAVPESGFNLSYESLISLAARQALMDTFVSNPALYQELTSGSHAPLLTESVEADNELLSDGVGEDEDLSPTVDEVCGLILDARTVQDTLQPVRNTDEFEGVEGEDTAPAPPTPVITSTRSSRVRRRPSRYSGGA